AAGVVVVTKHVAVKTAWLDPVNAVFGRPMAFLIGDEKGTVVIDADAVCGAKAGGDNVGARAVFTHFQESSMMGDEGGQRVTGGFGVIEIALVIGLQAHGELVKMFGDLVIAVEVFVKVDLVIAVEVVQPDDLIAASDVDRVVDDFQAERL